MWRSVLRSGPGVRTSLFSRINTTTSTTTTCPATIPASPTSVCGAGAAAQPGAEGTRQQQQQQQWRRRLESAFDEESAFVTSLSAGVSVGATIGVLRASANPPAEQRPSASFAEKDLPNYRHGKSGSGEVPIFCAVSSKLLHTAVSETARHSVKPLCVVAPSSAPIFSAAPAPAHIPGALSQARPRSPLSLDAARSASSSSSSSSSTSSAPLRSLESISRSFAPLSQRELDAGSLSRASQSSGSSDIDTISSASASGPASTSRSPSVLHNDRQDPLNAAFQKFESVASQCAAALCAAITLGHAPQSAPRREASLDSERDLVRVASTSTTNASRLASGSMSRRSRGSDDDDVTRRSEELFVQAQMYEEQRDMKGVVHLLQDASDLGHPHAMHRLGLIYLKGTGVPRDRHRALKLLHKAAHAGSDKSAVALGNCFMNGCEKLGVRVSEKKAAAYFRIAADRGDATAQFNLGVCYEQGRGVAVELHMASQLYALAAGQGHPQAQYNMGVFHEKGLLGCTNVSRAVELYRTAARGGCTDAMFNLGILYSEGRGVEKDLVLANTFFLQAAQAGDKEARRLLGMP